MRAQSLVAFTFVASALVACSVTPRDTESLGQSTEALRPRGTEAPDPEETTPPSHPCPSQRVDLYRNATNCAMPPASSLGTWSVQPLFPNAPPAIRDRLCAYTWQPKDTPYTCAATPHATIPRNADERLGLRGHCPLGSTGCGTTVWVAYNPSTTFPGGTVATTGTLSMSKTTSSSSSGTTAVAQKQTSTGTTTSSSGSTPSETIVLPNGGVGCCDTCAEVQDHFAYVVLPENNEFSRVEFSLQWDTEAGTFGGYETIVIDEPATNVIQVNLNPYRRYRMGPVNGVHPIE